MSVSCLNIIDCLLAGLLANLTCMQAELYEMERDLSVREDPLWVVPYATVAQEFEDLLIDFANYAEVGCSMLLTPPCMILKAN